MKFKPLPIGIEDFDEMISQGYFYIDKTLFIKDLIDNMSKVSLFTRPRRFGKSLNISMLQHFFDIEKDSNQLFDGLNIMSAGEQYTSHMNQYPVISLTLKSAKFNKYKDSVKRLTEEIRDEFKRHSYILDSEKISEDDKKIFIDFEKRKVSVIDYTRSLKFLSSCLYQYYNRKTIILIDEYDVPLDNAYFYGFYDEMINFLRSLLGDALKTNRSLRFAILTGCLRISKESIFTGLNNLRVISILSKKYDEYFGFTEEETMQALKYYELDNKTKEVRKWYNGYSFGNSNVYNPWSVIHYLDDTYKDNSNPPVSYWSNTSSNSIIRTLIERAGAKEKEEIESLIKGGSITRPIHEDITYDDIDSSMDNLWNFLLFVGYLKKVSERTKDRKRFITMNIPNDEVLCIYEEKITEWFQEKVKIENSSDFYHAIIEKNSPKITEELNARLIDMISFYDTAENFYHGFLLGILANIKGYQVKSNRETGLGRSDIFIKSTGIQKKAIIFECKVLKDNDDAEEKCREAIRQIDEKKYGAELVKEGYRDIIKYGIVFRSKECLVMAAD
ncbi:MAG: ATP-binding protein [Lachnoclostridium sp.]|jgi:hypothetical protein|nr:ATP-binding protein [Lachnoclostridium sp.]